VSEAQFARQLLSLIQPTKGELMAEQRLPSSQSTPISLANNEHKSKLPYLSFEPSSSLTDLLLLCLLLLIFIERLLSEMRYKDVN